MPLKKSPREHRGNLELCFLFFGFFFFLNNEDSLTQKLSAGIKAAETTEGIPELNGEYSNRAELLESSQQVRLGSFFFCSSAWTELISRSLSYHSSEKCHQMGVDHIDASLLPW